MLVHVLLFLLHVYQEWIGHHQKYYFASGGVQQTLREVNNNSNLRFFISKPSLLKLQCVLYTCWLGLADLLSVVFTVYIRYIHQCIWCKRNCFVRFWVRIGDWHPSSVQGIRITIYFAFWTVLRAIRTSFYGRGGGMSSKRSTSDRGGVQKSVFARTSLMDDPLLELDCSTSVRCIAVNYPVDYSVCM